MAFSAEWLALREPADRAARDAALARQAAEAAGPQPLIVDLGCGTGATRRALASLLPAGARWRFVDSDPQLLEAAAADARATSDCVEVIEADIRDLAALPLEDATLVTASALLDLVPASWVHALAESLRVPFYAALSYNGVMRWTPDDAHDAAITDCFNRHQQGDKGLGPALGPRAGERSAQILADAGFEVRLGESPWRLGPELAQLQRELIDGIAVAAAEVGSTEAAAWGRRRREGVETGVCEIGHLDLLALPRRESKDTAHAR
ncbi:MAG: methyltransferase domain-containing protein [Halieaceae bacterium]|jgi:SAM-dependent methyltransferase|nr:methyltransferase domain-containing protein [Halieaceae bacterium]